MQGDGSGNDDIVTKDASTPATNKKQRTQEDVDDYDER